VDNIGKLSGEEKAGMDTIAFQICENGVRVPHSRPGKGPGISRCAHDLCYRFAPDCPPDRETPENGYSEVETVAFAEPGKG